ncbi:MULTISPECIES: histidinol-phosphate transaminase [unclassified Wenzhouxiangella]|uniref:histidinol-phosphate transaminase n=1 Tax=unclassified Wenzhouxiangella TaxID=2613841 RepID=UPI000E3273AC|nr:MULTISPECIES: histidinol-phosphate transaminase [unclassified Wenzhouxiangella]RFF27412.1 histidinol-phosphate transaminase [Wenzhouxiangella sp. 15181]RFP68840.1 histidinol-phosphate transaminase [Wenzhouxiangella sp. 15190]
MSVADLAREEIRALKPYASARALADSAGILLNANENPWPPEGDAGLALNRYPEPQPAALRHKLAEYYGIDEQNLLLTRGSDEGIDLLNRVFVRPGEDGVITCPPCFGMYALSARIQGARLQEVPLIETAEDFELDLDGLSAAAPAKLLFLCSPNNPTGNGLAGETVLALARERAEQGLVVLDEAYIEFSERQSLAKRIAQQPNLVVLRTLSKAFGLAGCRLGALIASVEVVELLRRIIPPYPLPTPAVAAAETVLEPEAVAYRREQLDLLMDDKRRLVQALETHASIRRVWPGEANFVLVRADDGPGLVRDAAAAGIRLRDQSSQPGLSDCVRITLGTPEENTTFIEFLQAWDP